MAALEAILLVLDIGGPARPDAVGRRAGPVGQPEHDALLSAGGLCMGRMVAVVLMGVEATAQLAWRR
jgi:hypothetical protein